jgi:hypothetical protein
VQSSLRRAGARVIGRSASGGSPGMLDPSVGFGYWLALTIEQYPYYHRLLIKRIP